MASMWLGGWKQFTYKLNCQKYKQNVSGDKKPKFQGTPFPISSTMNTQMIRSLASSAVSKCKPFLQEYSIISTYLLGQVL